MLSPQEIEAAYQLRLYKQMAEQQLLKFVNPDRDISLEGVWVAYEWHAPDPECPAHGEWILAGFRRRRNRRKDQSMNRFFSKVRRKLGINKKAPVMLYDLGMALRRVKDPDQMWRFRPPQFGWRKPVMKQITPVVDRKRRKQRAKQKAFVFNPKTTKYVGLGKSGIWHKRSPGYTYLGPLTSDNKRSAQAELKRLFPIYAELMAVPVTELSVPLRAAMARNRKVRAGATRIAWPEVPPSFDKMWDKFVRHLVKKEFANAIEVDDPGLLDTKVALHTMWEEQKCPWLTMNWFRHQIESWSGTCEKKSAKAAKVARRKSSGGKARRRDTRTTKTARRTSRSKASSSKPVRRARKTAKRVTPKTTKRSAVLHRRLVVRATVVRKRIVRAKLARAGR